MNARNSFLPPSLRAAVNAIAPMTQHGPLEPQKAPRAPESYADMVARFAESDTDVATLSLAETAALLQKYPESLLEPIADSGPRFTELLTDAYATTVCIEARVGRLLIDLARAYAIPLLRQDIYAKREVNRVLDEIEDLGSHFPKTDEAQSLMTELGLGRAFR